MHSGEAGEFAPGPDDRTYVGVGDLHETVAVERLGNAVGDDLHLIHPDRRAPPRRTP